MKVKLLSGLLLARFRNGVSCLKFQPCDRCFLYAHNPYVVCSVHPDGVKTNSCIDFRPDPNAKIEEQWSPAGYSYYDGNLVRNQSRYTRKEQWEILNTHPFFTGVCPQCRHKAGSK